MATTIRIGQQMARTDRPEVTGGGASRGIGGVRGASGRGAVKPTLKGKLAEPKSGVKVKPPAKTKPAPQNSEKIFRQNVSSWQRGQNSPSANKPKFATDENTFTSKARQGRIINSKNPSASGKASRPVVAPKKK
jgi:hypothetical protein